MKGFILARAAVTVYGQKAAHRQLTKKQKVSAGKGVQASHSRVKKNVSSVPLHVLGLRVPSNPKSVPRSALGYKVLELYNALITSEYEGYRLAKDQKNELLEQYKALWREYMVSFYKHGGEIDKTISVLNLLVDEQGNVVEDKAVPTFDNDKVCSVNASEIKGKADTEFMYARGYSTDVVSGKLDQVKEERVCASAIKSISRGGGK